MTLTDIVNAITAATELPFGRVYAHARRLQEVGCIPIGTGGRNPPQCDASHAVLILFSLLSGKPLGHASRAAIDYCGLLNDGSRAIQYLTGMIEAVQAVDIDAVDDIEKLPETLVLAFKSHVTIVAGDQPAIVVRYSCTDTPLETAFTVDGVPYEPEAVETITESRSIPGILIFRLGRALRLAEASA